MPKFIVSTVIDAYQSYWVDANSKKEAEETIKRIFTDGPSNVKENQILETSFGDSSYGDAEIISVEEWDQDD